MRRLFDGGVYLKVRLDKRIILTMVLLFSVLIYYRINIFWFWLYQGGGAYLSKDGI